MIEDPLQKCLKVKTFEYDAMETECISSYSAVDIGELQIISPFSQIDPAPSGDVDFNWKETSISHWCYTNH
jgi:hypothetical protein